MARSEGRGKTERSQPTQRARRWAFRLSASEALRSIDGRLAFAGWEWSFVQALIEPSMGGRSSKVRHRRIQRLDAFRIRARNNRPPRHQLATRTQFRQRARRSLRSRLNRRNCYALFRM